MDHYSKTKSVSDEPEGKKEPCDIQVKSGSKIRNIISQAMRILQSKKGDKIVITGSGPTVTKTITCAEIIKRKFKGLHQLNKLFYIKIEDTWEPKEESLDTLQVTKRIPSISITLSKVPLDATQPGYQAPGKSISPVQFGDEDWELAWEDDSAEAKQRTNKGQLKNNKKRKNKQSEDSSKVANSKDSVYEITHSNSEGHSERGANGDVAESQEGQLGSKVLKKEAGHSWKSKCTDTQESKSTQKTQTPIKHSPQKQQITQESAK